MWTKVSHTERCWHFIVGASKFFNISLFCCTCRKDAAQRTGERGPTVRGVPEMLKASLRRCGEFMNAGKFKQALADRKVQRSYTFAQCVSGYSHKISRTIVETVVSRRYQHCWLAVDKGSILHLSCFTSPTAQINAHEWRHIHPSKYRTHTQTCNIYGEYSRWWIVTCIIIAAVTIGSNSLTVGTVSLPNSEEAISFRSSLVVWLLEFRLWCKFRLTGWLLSRCLRSDWSTFWKNHWNISDTSCLLSQQDRKLCLVNSEHAMYQVHCWPVLVFIMFDNIFRDHRLGAHVHKYW